VYVLQIQCRECQKLVTYGHRPLDFRAEAIVGFRRIKFYHRANNRGKYANQFCTFLIDNSDGDMLSPLIRFTCTVLHNALLQWQKSKAVPPKASKSKLHVDRPDRLKYFNHHNDCGKDASCCAAMSRKLLTSPGVADMYTFSMNTWNTLLESDQWRVYKNTRVTVKHGI